MAALEPGLIDEVQATWLAGPVSIVLATSDAGSKPTLCVGLGVRIAPDRRRLAVFVLDTTGRATLANVRANRPVAIAFTHSGSARGLQVKARSARIEPLEPGDRETISLYADALAREWAGQGQAPTFAYGVLCRAPGEIVAVVLEPAAVFEQSPGPNAGAVLAERVGRS